MLKSKDIGHIILTLGTSLIVGSLLSGLFAPPIIVIIVIQIIGWCLYGISLIFMILIKKEYHISKLKNGFSIKVDNLIFYICFFAIILTFLIFPFLGGYIYTDNVFHALIFSIVTVILLGTAVIRNSKMIEGD